MLADPASGGYLDFADMLPLLPVNDFILPGLFLTAFMGLFPLFLVYGLIARPTWPMVDKFFKWSGHYWAWTGTDPPVCGDSRSGWDMRDGWWVGGQSPSSQRCKVF